MTQANHFICHKANGFGLTGMIGVGMIMLIAADHKDGFLLCNGGSYKVDKYPDLYGVIGDQYNPPKINKQKGWWLWRRTIDVDNPYYQEGYFTVPFIEFKEWGEPFVKFKKWGE